MKVLYAVQGTGNGHLARARDVISILKDLVAVDVLVSGTQSEIGIGHPVKYQYKGISFKFGKEGGIDFISSFRDFKVRTVLSEIQKCPVKKYDLVINDFEAISAWACKYYKVPCVSLSHQAALVSDKIPRPVKNDLMGRAVIKYFAPCNDYYGFHFKKYDNKIFTPLVRQDIRQLSPTNGDHYTVYLPAYSSENIIRILSQIPEVSWHVFCKHSDTSYKVHNVLIQPIDSKNFIHSMASGAGVLCGAGFETPSEALYLGKKLLVIPMKAQYEQHMNAESLKEIGVPVLNALSQKNILNIKQWVLEKQNFDLLFPDDTKRILEDILSTWSDEYHALVAPQR